MNFFSSSLIFARKMTLCTAFPIISEDFQNETVEREKYHTQKTCSHFYINETISIKTKNISIITERRQALLKKSLPMKLF